MSRDVDQVKMYLLGPLILCFIGAVLLFATNFASAYSYNGGSEIWVWIAPFEGVGILSGVLGLILLMCGIFSILGLAIPDMILTKKNVISVMGALFFVLLIAIIGIIVLAIEWGDFDQWGPDEGGYAAVIAPLLSLVIFYVMIREL